MELPCTWDAPRPFVHPLTTPAGAVLSVEAPADHPWHHALWFTIKFVDGENFWEEYGEFGTLRISEVAASADGIEARIDWVAPDGDSVRMTETRTLRATPIDEHSYSIDWTEQLHIPASGVTLDRTPFTTWGGYGGLTLRGAPTWTGTVIRLSDGVDRDRAHGERSPWLSIEGLAHEGVPAPAHAGVVVFDHPNNVRSPSPWYASTRADTYGEGWANFVNAAFLWDEPLELRHDLPLEYRVIVHDGHWELSRIRDEYARWIH